MKTLLIIALIFLPNNPLFGQDIDSLILGTWRWTEKSDSTIVLKRTNNFKFYPMTLIINDSDTMYRSMRATVCGNTPKRSGYRMRRGLWTFDSKGFLVFNYEDSPLAFAVKSAERFRVIESTKKKITLRRVK